MAHIHRRSGRQGRVAWQARVVRLGYPAQFRTFDTKAEADAWARRTESEMDRGTWQDRSEADRTTLAQALERYGREITPHKALGTQRGERYRLLALSRDKIARIALGRLSGRDVADYIRREETRGVGPSAIRRTLSLLSYIYTIARSAWGMPYLINPVPLGRTGMAPVPPGRERRLQPGEEERLLEAATAEFAHVIRFALATAMRRGEIAVLQWNQVDLKQRAIVLGATRNKNRTARTVPLSLTVLEILRALPHRIDGSVFGMSPGAITLAWGRLRKKTGIQGLTFHDLRHEAISRLFENTDLDLMEIARISGHKTLQQLARYTHLRTARLADRLAGAKRG